MKTIKSNKEDLFFCHLGNGVSVCDRLRKENGDYIEVAHISYEREIIYYNSISDESREIIERFALYGNINMSVTQPYPVLNVQTNLDMKETLEEAAQSIAYNKMPNWGGMPMVAKKYFIKGAKWQKEKSLEVLSSILESWVHGGDADCIIAEFEEKLNNE